MDFKTSRRLYRMALRVYPAPFREANGPEMEAVCVASLRVLTERWGTIGVFLGWVRILADTFWYGVRLRFRGTGHGEGGGSRESGRLGRLGRALWADGHFAMRHLRRNPGFTLTAVGTLALGIGLNTAVFGAVYSLLLRPLPGVEYPQELVQVYRSTGDGAAFLPSSMPLVRDLRENGDPFTGVAGWTLSAVTANTGQGPERVAAQVVSSNFFEVLGVSMLQGRGFSGLEEGETPPGREVVLSEGFWRSHLGEVSGVLGGTVEINGAPYEIIGVAPVEFRGPLPVLAPVLWVPLSRHPELMRSGDQSWDRGNNFLDVVARLKPGVELSRAQAWANRFSVLLEEARPELYARMRLRLQPQMTAGIHPAIRGAQVALSGVLMAVVGLLLLIACVNVAGLFLAKAQTRHKEVAIRCSIGAGRRRLASQLLLESLMISVLAGGVGVLLARALVDAMNRVTIPLEWGPKWNIGLDAPVLGFALGVTLVTSLIFGLAPALRSTRPHLVSSLKGDSDTGTGRPKRAGRVLVGVQVAVATVLLVCSGLFAKNLRNAMAVDMGFRQEDLVLATLDPDLLGWDADRRAEFFSEVLRRVRALPGVRSVGLARFVPLGVGGAQRLVEIPGYQPSPRESMNIRFNLVSPGYFSSMGIPILEGRSFVESDGTTDGTVVVVNQRFADRFWPGQDPLGKMLREGGRAWEVVGVVPTGKYLSLGEDPLPYVYFPWLAFATGAMTLHVHSGTLPATLASLLREEVEAAASGVALYDLKTMEDHLSFSLLPARMGALVLGIFAVICLFLLGVGIHGVVALSVSRRTREVGIRVAMGAEPRSATARVLGEEARVVLLGILLGLAGAMGAGRLVESVLYSANALDLAVLAGAPLFLALVAGTAIYLPARRAARVDPAEALRQE